MKIPKHPRALTQLKAVRSKPLPGGGIAITSPVRAGAHGDVASAIVGALWASSEGASVASFDGVPRLKRNLRT